MTRIDDACAVCDKPARFPLNTAVPKTLLDGFSEEDVIKFGVESQMCENERFQLYYALRSLVRVTPGQREITFVEVGSYAGASLLQSYIALRAHALPVKAYAVEPGGMPQFYDVIKGLGSDVTHLKMYSDKAASLLSQELAANGSYADVIFIDGDHTYEGVKRDVELYFPLLKPNGIILFHDYLPAVNSENRDFIYYHHANKEPGIRQACDEYFNGNANAEAIDLPLLKPTDPTQTQSYLPIIPGVFSTVRAWRRRDSN
jgi:predicted O-methyltransferase YrrM